MNGRPLGDHKVADWIGMLFLTNKHLGGSRLAGSGLYCCHQSNKESGNRLSLTQGASYMVAEHFSPCVFINSARNVKQSRLFNDKMVLLLDGLLNIIVDAQ